MSFRFPMFVSRKLRNQVLKVEEKLLENLIKNSCVLRQKSNQWNFTRIWVLPKMFFDGFQSFVSIMKWITMKLISFYRDLIRKSEIIIFLTKPRKLFTFRTFRNCKLMIQISKSSKEVREIISSINLNRKDEMNYNENDFILSWYEQ